jgi:glutaredoxin
LKKITVYSTPTCSKCQMLKKILDSKNIEYEVESNMEKIMDIAREVKTTELPIMTISESDTSDIFSGSEAIIKGKGM